MARGLVFDVVDLWFELCLFVGLMLFKGLADWDFSLREVFCELVYIF
jgi:hypothetical protein